jgi:hypothetical protein
MTSLCFILKHTEMLNLCSFMKCMPDATTVLLEEPFYRHTIWRLACLTPINTEVAHMCFQMDGPTNFESARTMMTRVLEPELHHFSGISQSGRYTLVSRGNHGTQ